MLFVHHLGSPGLRPRKANNEKNDDNQTPTGQSIVKVTLSSQRLGPDARKSIPFVPTSSGEDPGSADPKEPKLGKRWDKEKVRNQCHKEGQWQERTHHSGAQVITQVKGGHP